MRSLCNVLDIHLQKNQFNFKKRSLEPELEETINYEHCRACEQNQIDLSYFKMSYHLVKEEETLEYEKCKEVLESLLEEYESRDKEQQNWIDEHNEVVKAYLKLDNQLGRSDNRRKQIRKEIA